MSGKVQCALLSVLLFGLLACDEKDSIDELNDQGISGQEISYQEISDHETNDQEVGVEELNPLPSLAIEVYDPLPFVNPFEKSNGHVPPYDVLARLAIQWLEDPISTGSGGSRQDPP